MRHYLDYKKLSNIFTFLLIGILMIFVSFPVGFSYAQNATDIQNKIDQNNSNIQDLEKEITVYQLQLDNLGQQKSSLSKSLKELDLTKKKLNADIAVTQNKIDKTNLTIQNLSSSINSKQNYITNDLKSIGNEIKVADEFERSSILENLLSQDDFTLVWNDIDNIATVREQLRKNIISLKQIKSELEDTRQQTIKAKNELTRLSGELADQKKIVIQNTVDKNKLLAQTKNNETNYQRLLKDRIAKRDAFEKELLDYEAQLQFVLDPSKLPSSRVLSWPLTQVFVTQLFGKTVAAKRLYASGTHNGVDFRASTGTPVMSMADGTVLGVGDTDTTCYGASFGKFVFIKYTNGLSSTFGHLSLIKVYTGQQVKRGDVVGYSGATGHVTGPHLHVSLYASQGAQMASKASIACGGRTYTLPVAPINAYLNVLDYLPPYTINTSILNNQETE